MPTPLPLDLEVVKKLLADQCNEFMPTTLSYKGSGWDHDVYEVNQRFIFRFPRHQKAAQLMVIERQLLLQLASLLSVSVPTPMWHGHGGHHHAWPFMGYRKLEGRTACALSLSLQQRRSLAKPLGIFLKQLHQVNIADKSMFSVQEAELKSIYLIAAKKELSALLQRPDVQDHLLSQRDWLTSLLQHQPSHFDQQRCLVHSDLYARHLLLDKNNNLNGIIDWSYAHWGHPAVDLSIIFNFLPQAAHGDFFQYYGEVSTSTLHLAKFRAAYYLVVLLAYALDIEDKYLLKECQQGFAYMLPTV